MRRIKIKTASFDYNMQCPTINRVTRTKCN